MNEPSIYIDCARLRELLIYSMSEMTKRDRMLYAERAVVETGDIIADFVMAYKYQDERLKYIRKMVADFEVLKVDLRFLAEIGAFKGKKDKNGDVIIEREIFECIARVDEGVAKYSRSVKA